MFPWHAKLAPVTCLRLFSGKSGRAAPGVHIAYLPEIAARVAAGQLLYYFFRRKALFEQRKPLWPVGSVRERLGRYRADARLRPGNDGADAEEL